MRLRWLRVEPHCWAGLGPLSCAPVLLACPLSLVAALTLVSPSSITLSGRPCLPTVCRCFPNPTHTPKPTSLHPSPAPAGAHAQWRVPADSQGPGHHRRHGCGPSGRQHRFRLHPRDSPAALPSAQLVPCMQGTFQTSAACPMSLPCPSPGCSGDWRQQGWRQVLRQRRHRQRQHNVPAKHARGQGRENGGAGLLARRSAAHEGSLVASIHALPPPTQYHCCWSGVDAHGLWPAPGHPPLAPLEPTGGHVRSCLQPRPAPAGGPDPDRHERAREPHLCPALPGLLHQGHAALPRRGARRDPARPPAACAPRCWRGAAPQLQQLARSLHKLLCLLWHAGVFWRAL